MTGKDENPANYNAITDYLTENFKDMDAALQVVFIDCKFPKKLLTTIIFI